MEMTLAILMVLGIFVGIPAAIGFAIVGTYVLRAKTARKEKYQVKIAAKARTVTV